MARDEYEEWRQRTVRAAGVYLKENWRILSVASVLAVATGLVPGWLWRTHPELRLGLGLAALIVIALIVRLRR